ncbi:MAG: hypothetical protein H6737_18300 [Alphaproteobacteria bacterium]|nr:hypothetical protein [Alphaproteobacteria bacterium]
MRALLPLLVLLAGCSPITRIGDKIIGLTTPVLVGGLVLGTQEPADDRLRLALEAQGITDFTEARLVVADALELRDIDNALIPDANVMIDTPDRFPLTVGDDGWYGIDTVEGPRYVPGRTWKIEAELPDRVLPGTLEVPLPPAAVLDIDGEHDPKTDLVVDLSGQGFDFAFAAVYDYLGNERWTNAPSTNEEIVDFVLPNSSPVERVVIPGDAFEDETLYVVGVAGMNRAPDETIEGLNEALTAVLAGELVLTPVVGGSQIALGALYLGFEPPEPPLDALLSAAGVDLGAEAHVYVVDLLGAGAGVTGADATVDGAPMVEDDPAGTYLLDGLDYVPGDVPIVRVDTPLSGLAAVFGPELPGPVEPVFPPQHPAGTDLLVQLPGGPWSAALAMVIGPNGPTWANLPQNGDTWRYVLENEGSMTRVTVPASAFPAPGVYALGVAGVRSDPSWLVDVNPEFSTGMAGQMTFSPITVTP